MTGSKRIGQGMFSLPIRSTFLIIHGNKMASDNKIIELIKQGDIAAFNTLFKSVYLQLIYIAENLSPTGRRKRHLTKRLPPLLGKA